MTYTPARYIELSIRENAAPRFEFRRRQNCYALYYRNPQEP